MYCTTHGQSRTKLYKAWKGMKDRCLNPKADRYADYGGRGITICERWMLFENFYADMGERPEGTTLDRVDNSKGYSPDNCNWSSRHAQDRNRRDNIVLTYNGTTMILADWAKHLGVSFMMLKHRYSKGYSTEQILFMPKSQGKRLNLNPLPKKEVLQNGNSH